MNPKKLIITADDFGLAETINKGIIGAYQNGFLRSTALLINAPASNHAITFSKSNPELEVGLHLAVVEGYLTNSSAKTLTETVNYFPEYPCLHKDWKIFLKKTFLKQIDYNELYDELKMQVELFLKYYDRIPFLNVTQHLQMLPKISRIICKLIEEYPIYGIRFFNFTGISSLIFNRKIHLSVVIQVLGVLARKKIGRNINLTIPNQILGIEFSGQINHINFKKLLSKVNSDVCEIVMHPGYDSPYLREFLPKSYNDFNWEDELKVLCDDNILEYINKLGFEITQFGEL